MSKSHSEAESEPKSKPEDQLNDSELLVAPRGAMGLTIMCLTIVFVAAG